MDDRSGSIAKRTRAKRREEFERRLAEHLERKQREKEDREAEEKIREESEMKEANQICLDDSDYEEIGEEINSKKFNKKRRQIVKTSRIVFDNNEEDSSGSDDVVILREVEKGEEVTPKNGQNACEFDEGSDVVISREAEKGEQVEKGGSGSGDKILMEEENAVQVKASKLNKRRRGTAKEGSGSECDIRFISEEFVPPHMRDSLVKRKKRFPWRAKRGRTIGNRTNETTDSGVAGRGNSGNGGKKKKGKKTAIENLDASESESSSSEEDDDIVYKGEELVSSYTKLHGLRYGRKDDLEGEDKDDGKMRNEHEGNFREIAADDVSEEKMRGNEDGVKKKRSTFIGYMGL